MSVLSSIKLTELMIYMRLHIREIYQSCLLAFLAFAEAVVCMEIELQGGKIQRSPGVPSSKGIKCAEPRKLETCTNLKKTP